MRLASVIIAVVFAAALMLAGCASAPGTKACSPEAKVCPDGSIVGIMGPNCEFAPCPANGTAETVVVSSGRGDLVDPGPVENECARLAESYPTYNKRYYSCTLVSSAVGRSDSECRNNQFTPMGCSICTLSCTLASSQTKTQEMTKELCESAQGHWNECASACWDKPKAEICTLQCVQLCECGGETGWNCPKGYRCYAPTIPFIIDNTGGCIPIAPSLPELAANQEKYLNRTVTVEGVLRLDGDIFVNARFFLDNEGSSVQVWPWAPTSVSTCPPEIEDCQPPQTISSFFGKKVRVSGTYGEYRVGNGTYYMIDVQSAEILNETAAVPMTQKLCETGNGVFMQGLSGKESHCVCKSYGATGCPTGYECVDEVWDDVALGVCRKI